MNKQTKQESEDWFLDVSDHIEEHIQSNTDDRSTPWIDQTLLDYSLLGLESIKV